MVTLFYVVKGSILFLYSDITVKKREKRLFFSTFNVGFEVQLQAASLLKCTKHIPFLRSPDSQPSLTVEIRAVIAHRFWDGRIKTRGAGKFRRG